jgi:hypothetical protein
MSADWASVDLARTAEIPAALVALDAAARNGGDLAAILPHMHRWPGVNRAAWLVDHADPASESPLETLGRLGFIEHDLPMPVANAWVGRDRPERRVDGLLPWHGWAWEGDGALKYDNRSDASKIVRDQNDREFTLRRIGLDFLRYSWADVFPTRAPFAAKARAMFADHPARSTPMRWWKHVPGVGPVEPEPGDYPSPYPIRIILPA